MTEEYISEGNMVIAKFMGAVMKKDCTDRVVFQLENKWKVVLVKRLKYHLSWNYIMPVYKELSEKLKQASEIIKETKPTNMNSLLQHIDDCDCTIRCHIWGVRIDDVFYGIVETIKLHNEKFNPSKP